MRLAQRRAEQGEHLAGDDAKVEAAALVAGLVHGHLFEVAHDGRGAFQVAHQDVKAVFGAVEYGAQRAVAQAAAAVFLAQLVVQVDHGAGDGEGVAQRGVEFVCDAGHDAPERSQFFRLDDLVLGVVEALQGLGQRLRALLHPLLQVLVGVLQCRIALFDFGEQVEQRAAGALQAARQGADFVVAVYAYGLVQFAVRQLLRRQQQVFERQYQAPLQDGKDEQQRAHQGQQYGAGVVLALRAQAVLVAAGGHADGQAAQRYAGTHDVLGGADALARVVVALAALREDAAVHVLDLDGAHFGVDLGGLDDGFGLGAGVVPQRFAQRHGGEGAEPLQVLAQLGGVLGLQAFGGVQIGQRSRQGDTGDDRQGNDHAQRQRAFTQP